jgi:NAD(P)-dependent dehydrogenase (short-subunit alcohol dehydrogenase family)
MRTPQQPIGSGFGSASTAIDVITDIDLTGTIAIVTGGYAGLGLETVRVLSSAGARVIVPARNLVRAATTLKGISNVEMEEMDLIDPASIDAFADRFLTSGMPLHILVNNAGIMAVPKLTLDARGFEYQFATNHLGHFQLTTRLLPALRQGHGARVVSVSSWGHRRSDVVFEDPNFAHREYDPMLAYGQSKSANILFSVALDAREQAHRIRAFSVHPGSIVDTNLGRNFSLEQLQDFGVIDENGNPILDPSRNLKTVAQGAATQVWCATGPQLNGLGGVYCENVEVARVAPIEESSMFAIDDAKRKVGVMPYAIDPESAGRANG